MTDDSGQSLLQYAVPENKTAAARLLIAKGAPINDSSAGIPIVADAIQNDNEDLAILLVEHGAAIDWRDEDGKTALHMALLKEKKRLTMLLIEKGVDVHAQEGRLGFSALHMCAENKWPEAAASLLKAGADPNAKTRIGQTPLHIAAGYDARKVVDMLLAQGVDVNAVDEDGTTPLHLAVGEGHVEIVKKRCSQGGDKYRKNRFGYTPLGLSEKGGRGRHAHHILA